MLQNKREFGSQNPEAPQIPLSVDPRGLGAQIRSIHFTSVSFGNSKPQGEGTVSAKRSSSEHHNYVLKDPIRGKRMFVICLYVKEVFKITCLL